MKWLGWRASTNISWALFLLLIACSGADRVPDRPDVIIVVIDSLRRDHLGSFGHTRETSPRMDRLFAEGVLFTNVVSVASHTVPVVVSLLTGRYPTETGVRYYGKNLSFDGEHGAHEIGPSVPEELELLSEAFRARGYRTAAAVSNPWLTSDSGFAQGFDDFIEIQCSGLPRSGLPPCDGREVLRRAKPFMDSESKPLFLYLHLMDVHYPYAKKSMTKDLFVTKPGKNRYRNGLVDDLDPIDRDYMMALYDEGILLVDTVIGELIDGLKARGSFQNTVLVITSDHGEEFDDHGGLGHGRSLFAEVVDTFLYVRHGDRLPSRRIDQAISTVDLAPTLFDLAGFTEAGQHSGQSLLGPPIGEEGGVGGDRREGWEVGRALFMDLGQITGLVRGPWKLIRHEGERVELYHLIEDPAERRDRSREETEIRDAMQLQLDAQLAHSVDSVAGAKELDSATVERLRAVGYVE